LGYGLLALSGAIYSTRPVVGRRDSARLSRPEDGPLALTELVGMTTMISWLIALPIAALMMVGAVMRTLFGQWDRAAPWVVVGLTGLAGYGAVRLVRRWSAVERTGPLADRVDVVEILDCRVQLGHQTIHETPVVTTVLCRFDDGTVRSFERLDRGPLDKVYPVGTRMTVRWNPRTNELLGPADPTVNP
jgi:hypothetical protein